MKHVSETLRPGLFSKQVATDSCRIEFDYKNEVVVTNKIPIDFIFMGDSITHIWELNVYFANKGKCILNRGIGGDTTEYALKRFEADVIQLNPQYIVCLIGINDSGAMIGDPVFGVEGSPMDHVVDNITRNISCMINLSQKAGISFIVCSILPSNMTYSTNREIINEMVYRANENLKEVANDRKVIYVDYHSKFVQEDGKTLKEGLSYDGLHPHVLGYNIMAEVLRSTLYKYEIEI